MAMDAQLLDFAALKAKQRSIRSGFPDPLGLRIHRAISWLGRSEQETADDAVRFILLWIGFNAAYARDLAPPADSQRAIHATYFADLIQLDRRHRIYNAVWERFSQEIRILLQNKFVFEPFWKHQNGITGYEDWEARLTAGRRRIATAMSQRDTESILSILFDRLYVLRNQLVHGGATWNGGANRDQVRDGAAVLNCLLPVFIDIMMDNPARDWGKPYYPVIE